VLRVPERGTVSSEIVRRLALSTFGGWRIWADE
jgi:hypothetical protein